MNSHEKQLYGSVFFSETKNFNIGGKIFHTKNKIAIIHKVEVNIVKPGHELECVKIREQSKYISALYYEQKGNRHTHKSQHKS